MGNGGRPSWGESMGCQPAGVRLIRQARWETEFPKYQVRLSLGFVAARDFEARTTLIVELRLILVYARVE